MEKSTIPVLDLNDFLSNDINKKNNFIKKLGDSLKDIGFFSLSNHGVDPKIIDDCYKVTKDFFNLPKDAKQKYENIESSFNRGFFGFGKEHAKDNPNPDLKEYFHIGPEIDSYPKNLWPAEVSNIKPVLTNMFNQIEDCAINILRACSIYIGKEEFFLADMATNGNSIFRLINYPALTKEQEKNINQGSIRAAPHEDINLITFLMESTDAGLELLTNDNKWMPIHTLSGNIIVDSGDMLQQLTNGLIKSTTHRVVNPKDNSKTRYSMPFFVHPRSEVDLTPIPECINKTGGKAKFPNITAGEYLEQRLKEIGVGDYKK